MDFNLKLKHAFPGNLVLTGNTGLPYFMNYPGYQGARREEIIKDMEYLQQIYPVQIKKFQRRVAQILDKTDYEGSMIYDEYPDYTSLRSMTDSIVRILKKEDLSLPEEEQISVDNWKWIENIVQMLLCDEIYKRRHGGQRGKNFWMN